MERNVLVSIGMPVYNGMPYIDLALESLLSQSHRNLELIISDDCSTDGTFAVCQSFADCDPRITLIRQPSQLGMLENFQFVFDYARGEYFMWASQDDIWDRDWIKGNLGRISDSHIMSVGSFCTIDESGRRIHAFPEMEFSSHRLVRVLELMYCHMTGVLMYGVFDRRKLEQVDGFEKLKGLGPTIDPLFLFKVGMAGPIARSSHSVLFKRVYNSAAKRTLKTRRIRGNVAGVASYAVSFFRLDLPLITRLVLAANTIPFMGIMLINDLRGTVYKRQNV